MDSGGNFYFSAAPAVPAEGDTQLAYFAGGTYNGQLYSGKLAGKLYTLLIKDESNNPIAAEDGTFWHKTWWADNCDRCAACWPRGEVMLHNWGLSIIAYTEDDITPSNNVKAVSFFDDVPSAIANVERAERASGRVGIWIRMRRARPTSLRPCCSWRLAAMLPGISARMTGRGWR